MHKHPLHTSVPSGRAFHRRETPDSTEPERRHFVKIASEKIIYNRQHMERPQREATWRGIFSTEKKTIFLCSTPGNCYRSEVRECKNFSRENSSLLVFRKRVSPGVTNLPSSCAKIWFFHRKNFYIRITNTYELENYIGKNITERRPLLSFHDVTV